MYYKTLTNKILYAHIPVYKFLFKCYNKYVNIMFYAFLGGYSMLNTLLILFVLACIIELIVLLGIHVIPILIIIGICMVMKHLVSLISIKLIRVLLDIILFIIIIRMLALIFII